MGRRTFAFVNEKQNDARIDRAALRLRTLKESGAGDVQVERARKKTADLLASQDVLRGWDSSQSGVFN